VNPKKALLIVLWLICVACFFVPQENLYLLAGRIVFFGMLIIHAIEWLAFRELLKGSANGAIGNLSGTLLFGILHIQEVRAEVEGRSTGA